MTVGYVGLDLRWGVRQSPIGRFLVAAVVAVPGSLAACAATVAIGITGFPVTGTWYISEARTRGGVRSAPWLRDTG